MTGVDFHAYVAARGALVDDALEAALPAADRPPQILHQAMRYCVLGGGKRLRPVLVLAGAEACGGDPQAVLPVACAVELIHAYSLIHDDLPAMDDSDTRHGRAACHIAFGEAIAILARDALHALAFNLITRACPACGPARDRGAADRGGRGGDPPPGRPRDPAPRTGPQPAGEGALSAVGAKTVAAGRSKARLDAQLVARGLADSAAKAQTLILAGEVY